MSVKDLIKIYQDNLNGINKPAKKKISAGLEIKKQIYEDALHAHKKDKKVEILDNSIKKSVKERIAEWKLLDNLSNSREIRVSETKQDQKNSVHKPAIETKQKTDAIKKDVDIVTDIATDQVVESPTKKEKKHKKKKDKKEKKKKKDKKKKGSDSD